MADQIETSIKKMAALARLKITGGDISKHVEKACRVIEYFEKLKTLKTEGVRPTSHAIEAVSYLRADMVRPFSGAEEIFKQAPEKEPPFIQVPKVI